MANPEIIFTCNSHCLSSKYIWSNPAVTTRDTQHTVLLQEDKSEIQFKPLLGSKRVEQSSMTAEQQASEEHFTYTIQQQLED
jgi:hypothetical protein